MMTLYSNIRCSNPNRSPGKAQPKFVVFVFDQLEVCQRLTQNETIVKLMRKVLRRLSESHGKKCTEKKVISWGGTVPAQAVWWPKGIRNCLWKGLFVWFDRDLDHKLRALGWPQMRKEPVQCHSLSHTCLRRIGCSNSQAIISDDWQLVRCTILSWSPDGARKNAQVTLGHHQAFVWPLRPKLSLVRLFLPSISVCIAFFCCKFHKLVLKLSIRLFRIFQWIWISEIIRTLMADIMAQSAQ